MNFMKSVLLAPNEIPDINTLKYPLLGSFKYDGNRCFIQDGVCYTRSMKVYPNVYVGKALKEICQYSKDNKIAFDGELWSPQMQFNELQTISRSFYRWDISIAFYCFDCLYNQQQSRMDSFKERIEKLNNICWFPNTKIIEQKQLNNPEEVEHYYQHALEQGFEGLILRNPNAYYKHGRATFKENIIHKLKAFDTLDAKVIDIIEQNSLIEGLDTGIDETGHKKRTHKQEHYQPANTAGALVVTDEFSRTFNVGWGKGWTKERRKDLWENKSNYIGRWVEIIYMPYGEKDNPRMPKLLRFRDDK